MTDSHFSKAEIVERLGVAPDTIVVTHLAAAYRDDPSLLPEPWRSDGDQIEQLRTIGDFIAGMTDRYALVEHGRLFETTPELR